ncbi:hypothetical protein HZ992_15505 [Rhizobacter sp. AJA081-3]|uniref:hypothetical protein n=1 Tax=Rhizobacter sp. AJA081-3 TaxID=2753607 RepID=UPI001ADF615A|nr:hypothetical protein [Rhizobacter sp. AJA081-3]QTN21585.1 hypothetical protein HZ992_15505 [Rhizobacter sp. AJA081-3]
MKPLHGIFATLMLGLAGTASLAAPGRSADACYVRTEASAAEGTASAAAASHLGLRRKTEQLFEVDISVSGPGDANCAVSGVARLRGEPGAEVLGLVIRPDPSRKTGRSGTLCQVFVQLTPAAVELRTTRSSCQAQSLCEGRIELNGQRFEHDAKLPAGSPGPCFSK